MKCIFPIYLKNTMAQSLDIVTELKISNLGGIILKRTTGLLALVLGLSFLGAGCTSSSQLEKTLKDNPEVLFNTIKAHPKAFLDTVNEAVELAKGQMADQAMEEDFKNRKEPKVEEGRVIFGPKEASITIVEYSDFQCPYCTRGFQTMNQLKEKYGDKVRIVYKHLPLDIHPEALPAAQYYEAIGMQDPKKAEKFHDMVFAKQNELNEKKVKFLDDLTKEVGADLAKVKKDIKSKEVNDRINADMEEAQKFGFSGTPGFLVNGVAVRGAYPVEHFASIIEKLETEKK
jgi:protein-disulfide isomerase